MIVVIAIAAGGGGSSSSLPTGPWGKLISCLQSHPLLAVYDATTANTPEAKTKALDIWQNVEGISLAYIGNNSLGADDFTGSNDANVNLTDGPLHYGFSPRADTLNKSDISTCVTRNFG